MTEVFVDEVVDEVINGFHGDKVISCPICRAIIDLMGQDLQSMSNYYFCANCGFTINRPKK